MFNRLRAHDPCDENLQLGWAILQYLITLLALLILMWPSQVISDVVSICLLMPAGTATSPRLRGWLTRILVPPVKLPDNKLRRKDLNVRLLVINLGLLTLLAIMVAIPAKQAGA